MVWGKEAVEGEGGWMEYIQMDVLSWAQKITVQSGLDYLKCPLAGLAWCVICAYHLSVLKQISTRVFYSTFYRFLASIIMTNSSFTIQNTIFLKAKPFPIHHHALTTASAHSIAKCWIRGIKQVRDWYSSKTLSACQPTKSAYPRHPHDSSSKRTDLCLNHGLLFNLGYVLCSMVLDEQPRALFLMLAAHVFGEGCDLDILVLAENAFHGGLGTSRHVFLQHEEREFCLALVGALDGYALVEVLQEGRLQVFAGFFAVVAGRGYAGLADYDGAALVLKGLEGYFLAESAAEC